MAIIDNEHQTLEEALSNSLPKAESIDILTAYFYFSGFSMLIDQLKDKKIRILVGKAIDPSKVKMISRAVQKKEDIDLANVTDVDFDAKNRLAKKADYLDSFVSMVNSEVLGGDFDLPRDRRAFAIFEEKMRDGSLEIKMTSNPNHAKVYILKNKAEESCNGDMKGCVFHGSNNFTYSGLRGQGEVATSDRSNEKYEEFSQYFDRLWNDGDKTIEIQTKNDSSLIKKVEKKTWLHAMPTPYEIYARILTELYGVHENAGLLSAQDITEGKFSNLSYQYDAVAEGVACIERHMGVIIADVVGLGKSVIASAIAKNIDMDRTVVIAPPHLVGQWEGYCRDFKINNSTVFSRGKMSKVFYDVMKDNAAKLFIVDEAHYYRSEYTKDYTILHKMIRMSPGSKVILLTATPYNNRPSDIYSLLKLFQVPGNSTICAGDRLNDQFAKLNNRYERAEHECKLVGMTSDLEREFEDISREIRNIISPVIIRRSRIDLKRIKKYADDLRTQGFEFPTVRDPELLTYEFSNGLDDLYARTIEAFGSDNSDEGEDFIGAMYKPLAYISNVDDFMAKFGRFLKGVDMLTTQRNLASFARRLLVMRLESSKEAFRKTLDRMINRIEEDINWWMNAGYVRMKPGTIIREDDDIEEAVSKLRAMEDYGAIASKDGSFVIPKSYFTDGYINGLMHDREILIDIRNGWFRNGLNEDYDPKLDCVLGCIDRLMAENNKRKIVIFTQYSDTAAYVHTSMLYRGYRVMCYTGSSNAKEKREVSRNFDASWPVEEQLDDYDVIVATDALSEGFNLHRAGVIINYDIPYNPTRVTQRVGRINRINKKMFDELRIFNFFPSVVGEEYTNVASISKLKVLLINNIIGSDTKILTCEESLESYFVDQYRTLNSQSEQESWDVTYRNDYELIAKDEALCERIRSIPPRTRIGRAGSFCSPDAIFFAKKSGNVIYAAYSKGRKIELSLEEALPLFKASEDDKYLEPGDGIGIEMRSVCEGLLKGDRKDNENTRAMLHPKIQGNLGIIDHYYPQMHDLVLDIEDSLGLYDDFSGYELRKIYRIDIEDVKRGEADYLIESIKRSFTPDYLASIARKASDMNNGDNLIMFTEEFKEGVDMAS